MIKFKTLKVKGFKSFVEPTEVIIEQGLTGIVGPNGCGKSNLVEAFRFVMGELSPKQMRGSELDDVIFNGTSGRPARESLKFDQTFCDAACDHFRKSEFKIGNHREVLRLAHN